MPDNHPGDDPDVPPESTISDGTTDSEVEAAKDDTDTVVVDLRSAPSGVPNPSDAESRLGELQALNRLGLLLPDDYAELKARESEDLDPATYTFEDYWRNRGVTDDVELQLYRRDRVEDVQEAVEELRDDSEVDANLSAVDVEGAGEKVDDDLPD